MVSSCTQNGGSSSFSSSTDSQSSNSPIRQVEKTSVKKQIETHGFSFVRDSLTSSKGIPDKTKEIIMSSWRKVTRYKYELVLRKWEKFSTKRGSDPYNTNVNNILDFLTELYEKGKKYSSICSARSALAAVVKIDSHSSISDHPLCIPIC